MAYIDLARTFYRFVTGAQLPRRRRLPCRSTQPDQDDDPNSRELRRDVLVDTILESGPDLIGTQELFTRRYSRYVHVLFTSLLYPG